MEFDVFFSISQTPNDGVTPSEREMFENFFAEVEAADALGFGTAWIAETHLSTEVQKQHDHPVVPHWQGEIGLNTDIFQLAARIFARTERIAVGSAVTNIVCNGGPIAHAERIAAFCSLHGLDPSERRRLAVGFSAGRFQFMNRAYGIKPRNAVEAAAWPALRGLVYAEACEIFLRLLRGDVLSSEDIAPTVMTRAAFRSDADWDKVRAAAESPDAAEIPVARRWEFDVLQIVPKEWRRDVLELVIGSHDPALQVAVNQIMPVKVFNLSITQPELIDATHTRMADAYHPDGGTWQRRDMPRTVMVFLNEQPGLSPQARSAAAKTEAKAALGAYWTALEGTLDPAKVARASDNAVIGNAEEVAAQIRERFHPEDRLMLWFDFFNHDASRVIDNMRQFQQVVVPLVEAR
jgi:alkanesulfonate monooxygenase SsuD/methylene tetrahydromethanopterin reductase-like flavin-dependent oxidoreductase (luciferase family)